MAQHYLSPAGIILLIVLVVLIIAGLPHWPYNEAPATWGYYPAGLLGVVALVVLVLLLVGLL